MPRTILYFSQVLASANAHHKRTGKWPGQSSGRVHENREEKWTNIDQALRNGFRGFPGGYSLAQLLTDRRGVRNRLRLPKLTPSQLVAWADAYHKRTGKWPTVASGAIKSAPGESWLAVDLALRQGRRGLPSGSSLGRLLYSRGARFGRKPPRPYH